MGENGIEKQFIKDLWNRLKPYVVTLKNNLKIADDYNAVCLYDTDTFKTRDGAIYSNDNISDKFGEFASDVYKEIKSNLLDENLFDEIKNGIILQIREAIRNINSEVTIENAHLKNLITIQIPIMLKYRINNGVITDINIDNNCRKEEIKLSLCEIGKIVRKKDKFVKGKFKGGRKDKESFVSMALDLNEEHTHVRFPRPDVDSVKGYCSNVKQIIQNDKSKNNILLIPYSADGHIVTLIVDKNKFNSVDEQERKNSIMCFDSSHAFTKWYGSTLNNKHFSDELYDCISNDKRPINDKNIQGFESTCSFYTEAFLKIMDEYIINKETNDKQCDLEDIKKFVNSEIFINNIKLLKEEYIYQYTEGESRKYKISADEIARNTVVNYCISTKGKIVQSNNDTAAVKLQEENIIQDQAIDQTEILSASSSGLVSVPHTSTISDAELENISEKYSSFSETNANEYAGSVSASVGSGVSNGNPTSYEHSSSKSTTPDLQ
ncbi:MAG: hypothetical protein J6C50_01075 [Rickettsiales bacterium]|nr:hypothetical protein [Rickettsiales bacterium]